MKSLLLLYYIWLLLTRNIKNEHKEWKIIVTRHKTSAGRRVRDKDNLEELLQEQWRISFTVISSVGILAYCFDWCALNFSGCLRLVFIGLMEVLSSAVSISPLQNEGRMVLAEGLADETEAVNNCSDRFSIGGGGDNFL